MMSDTIKVELTKELQELANLSDAELNRKYLQIWVMELYSLGKITQSKAAGYLNINVSAFLQLFQERHYKRQAGPQSPSEADTDLEAALP